MREKGCPPADTERLLAGLPPTFEEWAEKRAQTPITTDLVDGELPGEPPAPGSADRALPTAPADPEAAR